MPSLLSSVGATSIDEICDKQPILWRIIGVFDGKVRIRRDSNIGRYLYDRTKTANNIGGINQWAPSNNYQGADIMKLLNPGYETNTDFDTDGTTEITINNSLYWNNGNGNCWGANNGSYDVSNVPCDFVGNGLSDEAKEFIVNQTVYLGGFDNYYVFANQAYTIERGTNVIQNPIDGIPRTVKWTGKVGLPYPSDVGYASDLNDINCQNHLRNFAFCNSNWMMDGSSFLQNPSTNVANYQSFVYKTKNTDHNYNEIDSNYVNMQGGAWPVVTLSPDVYISQGTGSKDDPYVINGLNYEYEYVSPFQIYEGKPE